jgi:hypothetical protein
MNVRIEPVSPLRSSDAVWLLIDRDDEEGKAHALLFDELEAVRDAIEEYLEKVSQEEMK